jgi:hypothetical protein
MNMMLQSLTSTLKEAYVYYEQRLTCHLNLNSFTWATSTIVYFAGIVRLTIHSGITPALTYAQNAKDDGAKARLEGFKCVNAEHAVRVAVDSCTVVSVPASDRPSPYAGDALNPHNYRFDCRAVIQQNEV